MENAKLILKVIGKSLMAAVCILALVGIIRM